MSVVAFDGKTLAADKQATCQGIKTTCHKIALVCDEKIDYAVAWVGVLSVGQSMMQWFASGADADDFPSFGAELEGTTLLIVASRKGVMIYEQNPVPLTFFDKFQAWGSGGPIALGAMAMGADAKKAVKIASTYDVNCGMGIEYFTVKPDKKKADEKVSKKEEDKEKRIKKAKEKR